MEDPEASKSKRPLPPPISNRPSLSKPPQTAPPPTPLKPPPVRNSPQIPPQKNDFQENTSMDSARSLEAQRRGRSATTPTAPLQYSEDERNKVIAELLATEETYVKDLQLIVEKFQLPMEQKNLVSSVEIKRLFCNIDSIQKVNQNLLARIKCNVHLGKQNSRNLTLIGTIFPLEESAWIQGYKDYCSNLSEALKLLDSIKKKSNVQNFLKEVKEDPACRSLELVDFLMIPMQRICRYPLLLKEIIKVTPPAHEDFKHNSLLLEALTKQVQEINTTAKEAHNLSILLEKESTLAGSYFLIMPSRRKLLFEGKLKENRGKQLLSNPVREVWLFSDVLLIFKPHKLKKNTLIYKTFIPIQKLQFSSMDDTEDLKYIIRISHSDRNKFHFLCSPTAENKILWLKHLEKATNSNEIIDEGLSNQLQVMEIQDQIDKMERIESNFSRTFIRQGALKTEEKNLQFFLFSDILVYASDIGSKKRNYSFKGWMPTVQIVIVSIDGNAFEIIRTDTQTILIVQASSEEEKINWIQDFHNLGTKLSTRKSDQQKKFFRQSVYSYTALLKNPPSSLHSPSSHSTTSTVSNSSDEDEGISLNDLRKQLQLEKIDSPSINSNIQERNMSIAEKPIASLKKIPSFVGSLKKKGGEKQEARVALNKAEQAALEFLMSNQGGTKPKVKVETQK